jgi:hypothetical protein
MELNNYHSIDRLDLSPNLLGKIKSLGISRIGALRKATRQSFESLEMVGETRIQQIENALIEAGLPSEVL